MLGGRFAAIVADDFIQAGDYTVSGFAGVRLLDSLGHPYSQRGGSVHRALHEPLTMTLSMKINNDINNDL